jgi:hypothetical protein
MWPKGGPLLSFVFRGGWYILFWSSTASPASLALPYFSIHLVKVEVFYFLFLYCRPGDIVFPVRISWSARWSISCCYFIKRDVFRPSVPLRPKFVPHREHNVFTTRTNGINVLDLHANSLIFSDFDQNQNVPTDFNKTLKYKFSRKNSSGRNRLVPCAWKDGQT